MVGIKFTYPTDPIQCRFISDLTTQRVSRIGWIGDNATACNNLYSLTNQSLLRIIRMNVEKLAQLRTPEASPLPLFASRNTRLQFLTGLEVGLSHDMISISARFNHAIESLSRQKHNLGAIQGKSPVSASYPGGRENHFPQKPVGHSPGNNDSAALFEWHPHPGN